MGLLLCFHNFVTVRKKKKKRKRKRINWTSQVTIQDGFIIHGSLHSIFFIIGNYVRNKLVLSYWKLNAEISGMNYGIFVLEVYNTQPTFGARSVWSKVQKIIIIIIIFLKRKSIGWIILSLHNPSLSLKNPTTYYLFRLPKR